MASKTRKMIQLEEAIKKKIVAAHRAGLTGKEGVGLPKPKPRERPGVLWTIGDDPPIRVWQRDENGNLIGD